MKKIAILLSALSLLAFVSCDKNGDDNGDDAIIFDGFYVSGPATGSEGINANLMMTTGINEKLMADGASWDESKRDGMYEKYVALKANEEFSLIYYTAGKEERYSSKLDEKFNPNGENDQIAIEVRRGRLEIGANAPAMKVEEDGLYHIVLDLDKAGDLGGKPQIIIAPVSWGVRGVNGNWGWQEMKLEKFDLNTMTWTINEFVVGDQTGVKKVEDQKFKFAYGNGWKLNLDDAGNVKAHTNLGTDMKNGGADIEIGGAYNNGVISLTWTLKEGEIKNSYSWKIDGEPIYIDPREKHDISGFKGSCFDDNWSELQPVTFDESKSKIDATTFKGTYVYTGTGIAFKAGSFKVIYCDGWYGAGNNVKLNGITVTGTDNFDLATAGTYDVVMTVEWTGSKAASITVDFTESK